MAKKKKAKHTRPMCSAGEYYWLKMQMADTRRKLNVTLFATNLGESVPKAEDRQESIQTYMVLIE